MNTTGALPFDRDSSDILPLIFQITPTAPVDLASVLADSEAAALNQLAEDTWARRGQPWTGLWHVGIIDPRLAQHLERDWFLAAVAGNQMFVPYQLPPGARRPHPRQGNAP